MNITKAIHLRTVVVEDPDSKGTVELAVYKDPVSGGVFAVDASFLEQVGTFIPSIYNSGTLQLAEDEESSGGESAHSLAIRSLPVSDWSADPDEPRDGTIHATTSPGILAKADRLFRNDDAGIFAELLQNARRAGATFVDIHIEEAAGDNAGSRVTLEDNGRGIADFQTLLTLGGSGWNEEVQRTEDPAGMGFFSLCHSDVVVSSGTQSVLVTREVFLGKAGAQIVPIGERILGTRIVFTRGSDPKQLASAIQRVAEFCPIEVHVNEQELPRHDFLEGALYRQIIDGIEVGFATSFRWHASSLRNDNWNFHGLLIRESFDPLSGLLVFDERHGWSSETLYARFNVIETGRVKLQLPDRRSVVQDDRLAEFKNKVRGAAFRYFQTQEHHALSFADWKRAHAMGVELREASPFLQTWHASSLDDGYAPFFGKFQPQVLSSVRDVCLVALTMPYRHTFEAALQTSAFLEHRLYQEEPRFEGYTWYDALPRLTDSLVTVDGMPYGDWRAGSRLRPERIELAVTMRRSGQENAILRLPAAIHVPDLDEFELDDDPPEFVAVRKSPWDNDGLDGPFSISQFLLRATFLSNDDMGADSWETQRDAYQSDVERVVDLYFRGPRAALLALLDNALSWDAQQYAVQAGVNEIRFRRRTPETHRWDIELMERDKAA